MPTSPKATAMPGGAPLKRASKRPCKYGPRDSEGRCPKKPRTTSSSSRTTSGASSSKSSKRPCKYGARIDGKCPPKPKTATVRKLKSVDAAAQQAGEVLRSDKATKQQKQEAVKVLGAAVAGEAAKKVGQQVYTEARKAARKPAVKKAAAAAGKKAAKVAGAATVTGAILAGGAAALSANRRREAKRWADQQLALTRKRLKAPLTKQQADTLWQQYYDTALKKPVTNSYSGK